MCIRDRLYVSGFVPVFAGVALLAGQTAGAAVYSTMFYAMAAFLAEVLQNLLPVSYTHLDVYKRQLFPLWPGSSVG